MQISSYNRNKISAISFICILMVVMIHSHFIESSSYSIPLMVQYATGTTGLSIVAVPMFYCMSGLLFFNGINQFTDCFQKQRKRIRTLLLPYLIWNIIFVLWYAILQLFPSVDVFINSSITKQIDLGHPIETLSFLYCQPAGFHLWFLRDLICFVAFAPLLYFLCKNYPIITFFAIFLFEPALPFKGLIYFTLGAIIAINYNLNIVQRFLNRPICVFAFFIYLSNAILQSTSLTLHIMSQYYYVLVSICGMIVLWRGYDYLYRKINLRIHDWDILKYTFFIYLFHEPVFNIFKKLSLRFFGVTSVSLMILYFINIVIVVTFSYIIGKSLKSLTPKVYTVLTGGR